MPLVAGAPLQIAQILSCGWTSSRLTCGKLAVFLGENKGDSKTIFSKDDKRSAIVHKGKPSVVNKKELLKLRHYVRESIEEINRMDKE
jgi:hypothetical protein